MGALTGCGSSTYVAGKTHLSEPLSGSMVEGQHYWTSTTDAANSLEAWTVFSCDWGVYEAPKTEITYALAVR